MNERYLYKAKTEMIVDSYNSGKEDGEWVQGYLRCDCGKWLIYQFELDRADQVAYEVNPDTICQCTGIKNKYGKLVWENDIVKDNVIFGAVVWDEKNARFMIDDIHDGLQEYSDWWSDVEVIGNIFDNPELCKTEYCTAPPDILEENLPKQTNAERIQSLPIKELAKFLPIVFDMMCQPTDECRKIVCYHGECSKTEECALRWLQSEAEVEA